jgi:hypothetical protein
VDGLARGAGIFATGDNFIPMVELAPGLVPDVVWQMFAPYWAEGVFDPRDLVATFAGGGTGLMLFFLFGGHHNEKSEK